VISVDPGKPDADAGVLGALSLVHPERSGLGEARRRAGHPDASLYTAKESLNVITEGPFQPTTNAFTFTVTP